MENKKKFDSYKLIMMLIPSGFTGVFVVLEHFVRQYSDIDNYLISLVLNGIYSDNENYTFFVHPLLAFIIRILSNISSSPDWYLLIVWLCSILSLFFLCNGIIKLFENDSVRALISAGMVTLIYMALDTVHSNFTVLTAVLAVSGSILVLMGIFKDGCKREMIEGVVMWFMAWLYRSESCLVILMFFAIALVFKFLSFSKGYVVELIKRNVIYILIFVFITVFMFGSKAFITNGDKYAEGKRYSELRSSIVDYYEDGYKYLHLLMDTENMDADRLEEVLADFEKTGVRIGSNENHVKGFLKNYLSSYISFMLLLLTVLLSIVVFGGKEKNLKLSVAVSFVLGMTFIGFYYLKGRAPERIMLLFELGMLISVTDAVFDIKTVQRTEKKSLLLWTLLLIPLVFTGFDYTTDQNVFTANRDNENISQALTDDFYVWDVFLYDVNVMYPYWDEGKLFSSELIKHNIPDGEWIYGQPYFNEFLKENNRENPMLSLYEDEDAYYVGYREEAEFVNSYYPEGDKYEIIEKTKIMGIPVNKYMRK